MEDLSQALRQALQKKEQELEHLEKQVAVLHTLIDMAEEEPEQAEAINPALPIPPQRAVAPPQPAKRVKRFP